MAPLRPVATFRESNGNQRWPPGVDDSTRPPCPSTRDPAHRAQRAREPKNSAGLFQSEWTQEECRARDARQLAGSGCPVCLPTVRHAEAVYEGHLGTK